MEDNFPSVLGLARWELAAHQVPLSLSWWMMETHKKPNHKGTMCRVPLLPGERCSGSTQQAHPGEAERTRRDLMRVMMFGLGLE